MSNLPLRPHQRNQPLRNANRPAYAISLLSIGLFAGVLLTLSGCQAPSKNESAPVRPVAQGSAALKLTQAQEVTLGIANRPVHQEDLQDKVVCNGQIATVSNLQAQVFTPAKGRVLQVPVELGQSVVTGQLLAYLKSDDVGQLQSDLLQQVLQDDADIRQAKIQLDFSRAAFNRESALFKEGVSAKADMDNARQQYRKDVESLSVAQIKRRASINAGQERLSLYGVSSSMAQRVLQTQKIYPYLSVRAPRSGVVIERNVNVGELADTNTADNVRSLFTIADLHEVWIIGDVYEKDISKLRVGQPVQIELEDQPDATYNGRLNFVSDVLKPQTRTLQVRGEIPNPTYKLKPNMFARMSILVGSHHVLAVPSNAVEKLGDYNYVFVNSGPHTYEERKVSVGRDNGQLVEIRAGLQENERVVVQGTTGLKGLVLKNASDTGAP
jgi:cobalt-zinc-cadmium efflux system membrane fusion protein